MSKRNFEKKKNVCFCWLLVCNLCVYVFYVQDVAFGEVEKANCNVQKISSAKDLWTIKWIGRIGVFGLKIEVQKKWWRPIWRHLPEIATTALSIATESWAVHGMGDPNAWTTRDINICDITVDCILFRDASCNSFRAPGLSGLSTSNILGALGTCTLGDPVSPLRSLDFLGVWDRLVTWEPIFGADRLRGFGWRSLRSRQSCCSSFVSRRSLRCRASSKRYCERCSAMREAKSDPKVWWTHPEVQ